MAAADYGRRAPPDGLRSKAPSNSICPQPSGDYNPLFLCENNQGESILASRGAAGPRPLEWSLPARSARGAHTPKAHGNSSAGESSTSSSSYIVPASWGTKALIDDVADGRTPAAEQYAAALAAAGLASRPAAAASMHAGSTAGFAGMGSSREAAAAAAYKAQPAGTSLVDSAAGVSPVYHGPLLGPEIAGYKSVVTKNPVSPSGYSLATATQQPAAAVQDHTRTAAATSQAHRRQGVASTAAAAPAPAQQYAHARTWAPGATAVNPPSAAAAAAAAALATLGSRSKAAPTEGIQAPLPAAHAQAGSYQNCALPEFCITDAAVAAGLDSPASVLTWHVPDPPPAVTCAAAAHPGTLTSPAQHAVAGRRAAATWTTNVPVNGAGNSSRSSKPNSAAARAAATASGSQYVPSSSSSSRPPSQQLSEGLSKLKQLATQRVVSRIATPPANIEDMSVTWSDASTVLAADGSSRSCSSCIAGRHFDKNSSGKAHGAAAATGWNDECGWQQQQQQQQQQPQRQQQQGRVMDNSSGYQPSSYSSSKSNGGSSSSSSSRAQAARQMSRGGSSAVTATAATGFGASQRSSSFSRQEAADGGYGGSSSSSSQMPNNEQLQECATCGRSFLPAALERHTKICVKVFCEKRKVFNARARRLPSEAAKLAAEAQQQQGGSSRRAAAAAAGRPGGRAASSSSRQLDNRPAVSAATAKKSKWQLQSEQLRSAMRANGSGGGSGTAAGFRGGYPAAEPVEDNRILCPHCGRRFAELAAERHIPKCADIRAKPTGLKAGGGKGAYMRSISRR